MELQEHYPNKTGVSLRTGTSFRNEASVIHSHKSNADFTASFDYVMVFPMTGNTGDARAQTDVAKHCMHAMVSAGLEIYPYQSVQDDELLVLFRAPLSVLQRFADEIDYKMLLDPAFLQETLTMGDAERRIAPIKITHDVNVTPITPYEYVFLKYDEDFPEKLYHVEPGEPNAFTKSVRLKLIFALLRAPKRQGGCDLELSKLILKKKILCMYPLHDREISDQLLEKCTALTTFPWDMPCHDLKEYFGEKIALYNVFIGHYSYWLIIPSVVGLVFQLVVWGTLNFSHPVLPFFSLLVTVWAIVMLEYWKRCESHTAMRWGMLDFEKQELDRPEFKGELIKSYINGKDMLYFPSNKAQARLALSQTVITTFIMCVIGVVAAIYVLRFALQARSNTSSYASLIASVLNTVQIQIFNMIYQFIAIRLTDRENHRTDTLYEDSMIVKLFVFQFINSYASFFFLAFIAGNLEKSNNTPDNWLGQCGATNCMEPLSINVAIIFGTRLTLTNFLDIFLPWLNLRSKIKKETAGIAADKTLTPAENDYMLMEYNPLVQSIQNYADTAIQYGFSLLFITALPIACMCSLVSNYVKLKFQAWKLFTFYQRPVPSGAQDIGTWQTIFAIISVVAVITNAGLICFTMNVLWDYSLQGRVWIFIGFQWVLIFVQFMCQAVIPDVPAEVEIQQERIAFINEKVIEKVEDEDFGTVYDNNDAEDDEGDQVTKKVNALCPCLKNKGSSHSRRINTDLAELPVQKYPFDRVPENWPPALTKDDAPAPPSHGSTSLTNAKQEAANLPPPPPQSQGAGVQMAAYGGGGYAAIAALPPPAPTATDEQQGLMADQEAADKPQYY